MQLRAFQKRLLDEVTNYFEDGHMHIVAPPGAGKTVLGAKVVDQRNQKTLILVPSIMLKNQWQKVLTNFFDPQQLSVDLLAPELITLATYQDFFEKQERLSMDQSWELLVLDEAHHLKKTWAAMLLQMQKKAQVNTLSLTATPPYDAAESDWQRYVTLNGPIDEEIATAELISDGILTPYQDYVYLIAVSKESEEAFNEYLKKMRKSPQA